jgi:hypothetical protein
MKRAFLYGFICLTLCGTATASSLFPFYNNVQTEQGSFFAVRPLYSHTVLNEKGVEVSDYLWPIYSRKEFKDEQSSRALVFWYTHKFDAKDESPRQRNWLLPVYFQGRDVNGKGYFALFPLGGTIKEFLGRDEIMFVLFPAFGKSRINDVKTTSVLWPVYSHTRGEGIQRDRVFPIYGRSVLEGKYEKEFILWPFWTSADYFYPGDSGKSWILFPICGRSKLEQESTWWVIPPFFRFTDGTKQDRLLCPWPFIQKMESEKHSKFYIWPLWGEDQYAAGPTHRNFMLWPLLWSQKTGDTNKLTTSLMALPFFYQSYTVCTESEKKTETADYWKIWPLMSWQREGETSRFRMLELWPLKNSPPIERNWTPLWTLYKRTNTDGVVRKDALWFAWHSENEPTIDHKEWSLLKGLLAYKRDGEKQNLRVLYFMRFGE